MYDHVLQEKQILKEQVKQLYALAPLGIVATMANSVLVFFVMKDVIPLGSLVPWLISLWVITALRVVLIAWYGKVDLDVEDAAIWGRRFTVSLFLIGLGWGSLGWIPFSFSLSYQVFLAFVLGGMAAGASSTFSKVRWAYTAYILPAMVPLALHYLLMGDNFHYAMAAMTLLFVVLLSKLARQNYSVNRTSLYLRFENLGMIESLKQAKEDIELSNSQLVTEMAAKLEAEAELRAYQEHLETIVKLRTADLVAANENLNLEMEERKRTQEKLSVAKEAAEAASIAKSEFLANMSHEMRTPLAGTLGMIKLVLDMKIGDEERELLQMAKRSAESLLRIITDLLDFSRIEAGMLQFQHKPFSLPETVKSAVEVVSLSAIEKGLRLGWEVEESLTEVVGDEGRLRQVLVNLLGNAVKFTERGSIELTARRFSDQEAAGKSCILFSVGDTGEGIPFHLMEKIFGRFTQGDSSLTRKYGGTGLGLALSREIVEKLGGRIWAESTVGVGSTFYFTLPVAPLPGG
jgi:signal transduction histidine kinase